MSDIFELLPWHDKKLLELLVDRRDAGERDEVRLRVVWPQGDEVALLFRDCYALSVEMNFGVIAGELISRASLAENDTNLIVIRDRWERLGVSLEMLQCYRIETSATSSIIRIYAMKFELITPTWNKGNKGSGGN